MLKSVQKISKASKILSSELDYQLQALQHRSKLPSLSSSDSMIVEQVRKEGVCITSLEELGISSTQSMLDSAHKLLSTMSSTPTRAGRQYVLVPPAEMISYPDLYMWGLEERLLNIAENYIGVPAAYCDVSLRKDMPDGIQSGPRQWHIDIEDRRILKAILYLNDVGQDDGPFEYIPKPLTPPSRKLRHGGYLPDQEVERAVPKQHWKPCTGSAGTVIFTDTCSVFHHGRVPVANERYAAFFSYISKSPKNPQYCIPRFSQEQLQVLSHSASPQQKSYIYQDFKDYGKKYAKNF